MTEHSIQDPVADDDDREPTAPPDEDEGQATPPAEELPAGEALEARIEEDEATSESSPDQAETIAEVEALEAEPSVEAPVELPEETAAEAGEEPDAGGVPEPDEETVSEAPPEVSEELAEPAATPEEAVAEAEEETVVVPEAADDVASVEAADAAAVEAVAEAPAEEAAPAGRDPFRGPGDWYVVHTYAGYENKVKANLESRIGSMQMQEKIFEVEIPMEDVMEIKGGKKQVVQKKVFPGYLLVKMIYDNDSWYVVRNTPGVTGFVSSGTGTKPTPLSKREVEKILAVKKETQVKPTFRLEWEEGDVVRIIAGPFADFTGTIAEINVEQSKLKVLVNIFDRETPVELAFDQVAKA